MPIYESHTRPVTRIPDLRSRPEWDTPWYFDRNRRTFYRFTTGGTIFHFDPETGDVRSY